MSCEEQAKCDRHGANLAHGGGGLEVVICDVWGNAKHQCRKDLPTDQMKQAVIENDIQTSLSVTGLSSADVSSEILSLRCTHCRDMAHSCTILSRNADTKRRHCDDT